jgi:outer membrane protein OmpA-like peptidoglycan-associated protein
MTALSSQTHRKARALLMSAMLASAVCFSQSAMALDIPADVPEQVVAGKQAIQLDVDNRTHRIEIDLQRARGFGVDSRASKPELSDDTKRALREMIRAQSLKGTDAGRILVLGSNDDFTATGRAGRTGFAAAKAIRDFLINEGVSDDRIMVAGWQAGRDDTGALATLGSGGRALVAPLASEQARRVISIHGDPGRALAFDSAFARLTLARSGNGAVAPVASGPATKPLDIRPTAIQPVAPRPAPVIVTPAPAARPTSVFPAGLPETVQGFGLPTLPKAAEKQVQQASNRCVPPAMALDDFYPGGPIVACGQRHPSERRRPVY